MNLHFTHSSSDIFADDTTIYTADKSITTIQNDLNIDLHNVLSWCSENKMCINADKTKSMIICTQQKRRHINISDFKLSLGADILTITDREKLLGMNINHNLDWSDHIKCTVKLVKSKLYLLARVRKFLSIHNRKRFYYCFILPHFTYCSTIWGNSSNYKISLLERLQRRAMKLILDCDSSVPTKDIYVKLHWLPLRFKLQLNRVTFIHKAIHKLTPDYISSMFTEYVLPRCLRSTSQFSLRIPRARTEMYKQSIAVNGATEYNSLPRHIKDCSTIQSFKRSCKEWLFTEFLSSVCDF